MNKEIFLSQFAELFDETSPEDIQMSSKFKELDDWSSLVVLTLIVHFSDNYQFELTPIQIRESETIEDLYNLVAK